MDTTLSEELGREGLHMILTKIMRLDPNVFQAEEDQDTLIEIQDLAGEMAAIASTFPSLVAPFTNQEILDRLPLQFTISPVDKSQSRSAEMTIFINQVKERQSSQADVGFLMWPSAVVLSRYLATNADELLGKNVLEIGTGCGLTGLVAAKIKAMQESQHHTTVSTEVLLTDFNKVVVWNCQQNIAFNGLEGIATADELDFYKQDTSVEGWLDSSGSARDQVDLILAADVICQAEDAFAAARTIFSALKPGGKALVVSADSRHRFGVDKFEEACRSVDLHVTSDEVRNLYDGKLLSANMEKTTGYVDNMTLTMFTIFKPSRL
jgi:predicted nicotinamide N-methyase